MLKYNFIFDPLETNSSFEITFDEFYENGGGGNINYIIGSGLKVENNVLSVDVANSVEDNNTNPITAAAVYTTVGNIEVILETI